MGFEYPAFLVDTIQQLRAMLASGSMEAYLKSVGCWVPCDCDSPVLHVHAKMNDGSVVIIEDSP